MTAGAHRARPHGAGSSPGRAGPGGTRSPTTAGPLRSGSVPPAPPGAAVTCRCRRSSGPWRGAAGPPRPSRRATARRNRARLLQRHNGGRGSPRGPAGRTGGTRGGAGSTSLPPLQELGGLQQHLDAEAGGGGHDGAGTGRDRRRGGAAASARPERRSARPHARHAPAAVHWWRLSEAPPITVADWRTKGSPRPAPPRAAEGAWPRLRTRPPLAAIGQERHALLPLARPSRDAPPTQQARPRWPHGLP